MTFQIQLRYEIWQITSAIELSMNKNHALKTKKKTQHPIQIHPDKLDTQPTYLH